ncbi:hypothetical protein FACS1894187_01350 [Synergistales bacterium]|nr:hypothetical protein FACS1894187_01350 [Synergistales bacterium]
MNSELMVKFRIAETGEQKTLRYEAIDELAPCGFHPHFFDVFCRDDNVTGNAYPRGEFGCNLETYNRYSKLVDEVTRVDGLMRYLIREYGFQFGEVMKQRKMCSYNSGDLEKDTFGKEYKSLVLTLNALQLRKFYKDDSEAEAESIYERGPDIPEEYKNLYFEHDFFYPELIAAAATSPSELRLEAKWFENLSARWKNMTIRGLVSRKESF